MSALPHPGARRNVGERVLRVEDPALLRGRAGFVDDVRLPGTLVAVFVRSPHAHAAIRRIDASAARAMGGVHAVYTLEDLRPHLTADRIPLPQSLAELQGLAKKGPRDHVTPFILARDEAALDEERYHCLQINAIAGCGMAGVHCIRETKQDPASGFDHIRVGRLGCVVRGQA